MSARTKWLGSVSARRSPLSIARLTAATTQCGLGSGRLLSAYGACGNGVHGRDDERFADDVVDEEQHPRAQGFERHHAGGGTRLGCRQLSTSLR